MSLFEIGRLVMKVAGRDAGKKAVVVEVIDAQYVLIDGATRRRKANTRHLEPLADVLKVKKGASHADVKKEFEKLGLTTWETKRKDAKERPRKIRKKKEAPVKTEKPKKGSKKKGQAGEKQEEKDASKKEQKGGSAHQEGASLKKEKPSPVEDIAMSGPKEEIIN